MNNMANIEAAAPLLSSSELSEAVRSTAMLADVTISQWNGTRGDKKIMEDAKLRAGATGDVGRATINLLAGADGGLKTVKSAYSAVRAVHRSLTLPWVSNKNATLDGGPRLLTTMLFDRYMLEVATAKRAAMAALDKFSVEYPGAMHVARTNLGTLVADEDYPTVEDMRSRFGVTNDFQPIPAGTEFRGLPEVTMNKLAKQLERRQERMIGAAQASMWEQVRERVEHAVVRLADPEAKFQDSTIEHVKELVSLMPGWNVTGDSRVAEITADIDRMIGNVTGKVLRKDAQARMEATAKGRAVVEKLRAWGL